MESILLTAISTMPTETDSKDFHYKDIHNKDICIQDCISQFEPVFGLLAKKHEDNIHVLALCTEKTLNKKTPFENGNVKISAVDYTFYRMEQRGYKKLESSSEEDNTYIFQKGSQKVIFTIFKTTQNSYIDCLKESTNKIKEMLKDQPHYHFWINANGAFRDMYLLIVAIVSLMKIDLIIPHHVLLTNLDSQTIIDVKENFHIFDFVSGINDFVNFGHAKMLKEFYLNKEPSQLTNKLIDDINDTYLGLQFNNYNYFENAIRQVKRDISDAKETHDIDKTLDTFLPIIENDYGDDLLNHPNPFLMIKRCLDKKMYQHAATLIESNHEYYSNLILKSQDGSNYINNFAKNYYLNQDNFLDKNQDIGFNAIKDFSRYYSTHLHNGIYSDNNNDFINDLNNYQQHLALISKDNIYTTAFPCNMIISRKVALSISIYQVIKKQRNNFNHAQGQRVKINDLVNTMKLFIAFITEMLNFKGGTQVTKNVVNISGIDFNRWSLSDVEKICNNANFVDFCIPNLSSNDGKLSKKNLENFNKRRPDTVIINSSVNYVKVIQSIASSKKQYLGKGKEYWIATEHENGTITFNKYDENDAIQQQEDSKS